MIKSITILCLSLSILLAASILSACTPAASQPLPPVTMTVTATATTMATTTTTATATVPASTTPVVPKTTVAPTASSTQPDVNNNPRFFIGKDISSYVTPTAL